MALEAVARAVHKQAKQADIVSLACLSSLLSSYSISALSQVLLVTVVFIAYSNATTLRRGVIKLGGISRSVAKYKGSSEVNSR